MSRCAPQKLLVVALAAATVLLAVPARAKDFHVDPARSVLLVRVWKEGPASIFAHDHVARASQLSGTVRYDPARPDACAVSVEAPAAGLVMDEPAMRRRLELPSISEANRREIQNTMRGSKQLDVAAFPTLSFRSTRVGSAGDGALRVTGTLSLHGQTREVTFSARVEMRGEYLHATASFRFRQTDFGITPYSFGSAVRNQDEVEMQVELVAK
jgi:polyisoprenoid-binding protein YceI